MTARRAPALQPHHLADLRSSGLTDKTIRDAGFRSLTAVEVRQILNGRNVGPGLEIPYPAADGVAAFSRVKPDTPVAGRDGKTAKYLTVAGAGNRLFVPTNIAVEVCDDPTVNLWITEGEKKALKATQEGFPTLGLAGVWSWKTKGQDGQTRPLPELDGIIWEERTVYIVFDSDLVENPNVLRAEAALAVELGRRGAVVRLVRLPAGSDGGKVGLDDYLRIKGGAGLRMLQEEALEAQGHVVTSQVEHQTDLGNARRLVAENGVDLRYCIPQRFWFVWGGRHWVRDQTAEVTRRAKQTVVGIYAAAAAATDSDVRKNLGKHATRSESESKLRAMVELAKSEPGIPILPDAMESHPMLLNVANGTLDLASGTLRRHRRSDLLTRLIEVQYHPDATCPIWESFLGQIFSYNEDMVAFMRRAVGYSLTGDTSEQVLFFLYGTGANGKSTFLNLILRLLGRYGRQIEPDLLLSRRGEVHPTGLADLEGTRFAVAMEIEDERRLAESLVKQMTGGDRLTARRMRQDFQEFWPTHKLWLGANHRPTVKGVDNAIWRRILEIPFAVSIPSDEQDRDLSAKLQGELPGILTWAVRGCVEWQGEGLRVPDEVRSATDSYRAEQDDLSEFLEERCIQDASASVRSTTLADAYRNWTGNHISQKSFTQKLEGRGFARERKNIGIFWVSLGLRPDGESCERS
jgi:P4 family phage/plasmid primase-like protien